jgi:hypothetical protein
MGPQYYLIASITMMAYDMVLTFHLEVRVSHFVQDAGLNVGV